MRKFFYVLSIVVLTPIGVLVAAFALAWLTTGTNASVNIWNRSHTTLRNIVISVPGRSETFASMAPGDSAAFSAGPRVAFDVRVTFDAEGHHYDVPSRIHLLPFGEFGVLISIDDRMRVSVKGQLW